MRLLSLAVLALALAALGVHLKTSDLSAALLAGFALICAYTTWRAAEISTFLKIFVAIFSTEAVVFGALTLAATLDYWPKEYEALQLPDSLPLTVAMFSVIAWGCWHIPVVRSIACICDHYFTSNELTIARPWPLPSFNTTDRRLGAMMVLTLVLINQVQVAMDVRLSFLGRDMFTALQSKDAATFWSVLLQQIPIWVVLLIVLSLVEIYIQGMLTVRWRQCLTRHYLGRWLDRSAHYRVSLTGAGTDNPDQRVSEDINRFIDGGGLAGGKLGGYGIYSFTIQMIATLSSLVSYAIILWTLSAQFTVPGLDIAVPGLLLWTAIIYAGICTLATHLLGRALSGLQFERQHYEADFRFSLARIREYSEQVALLKGEAVEKRDGMARFSKIYANFVDITRVRMRINSLLVFLHQIGAYIPYIVAAPFYFIGKIQFGVLNQTAGAFGSVDGSLQFFVSFYTALTEFKAVLDRLTSFDASIDKAREQEAAPAIARKTGAAGAIAADHLALSRPDGRTIIADSTFSLPAHASTLFSGPSGSGKSTLFRAIAGLWPYGSGSVSIPPNATAMLLPQKPYIPIGTLRAAVCYPAATNAYADADVREALRAAQMAEFENRLDEDDNWSMRLSGGEQQRLAVARALLAKPDWLFLDEATAALDENNEAALYRAFAEKLPNATIVSIGHRTTLNAFHKQRVDLTPDGKGAFVAKASVTA